MHHIATISAGKFETKPVHVSCTCGTGGDFISEYAADYWIRHSHFVRLEGGVSTYEIVNKLVPPVEPEPPEPPAEESKPAMSADENEANLAAILKAERGE